ncbi:MAG: hypothetical protein K2H17_06180 [Duncaniella sp.]|uniref:hypothetical protein n=1 Tax=Duncaniella sp. TaxID=2518496 RepID=UPI0023C9CB03|nr:hypothetical protein [Duncaniella sp.]MDE5988967.1 hypothetical protein [Duncaniella sp.]
MADPRIDAIDARQKFIEAWNKTMIDIWAERIYKLKVFDTGALWRSPLELPVKADGRFYDITLSQNFLEYGLWQDLGVGRELRHGDYEHNKEYIEEHGRKRERRPWFSLKYYSSVMNLRDFMAESLGDEFKSMFCAALDSDNLRYSSGHYKRMGYTR